MKKNLLFVSILAAAVSMAACDDKEDVESHAEGAVRCNVNSAGVHFTETWKNGSWVVGEQCAAGNVCSSGRCLTTDRSCNDVTFAPKCVALASDRDVQTSSGTSVEQKSLIQYCSNGQIQETNCRLQGMVCLEGDDGPYCGNDAVTTEIANAECQNGEVRCNINGDREVCGGMKWRNDPCPTGKICAGGECKNPDSSCANGSTKCDGKDAYVCSNKVWEKTETCAEKCFAGACVAANYVPSDGDPCGDIDMACVDDTMYYCGNDDVIHTYDCSASDGQKCLTLSDSSQACGYTAALLQQLEAPSCTAEGQIVYVEDYSDHYEGTMIYLKCVKNVDDGKFYAVDDLAYSICDGNTLISNTATGITTRTCSQKCVEYPNHSAAQCEVNGKREADSDVSWCSSDGSSCGAGVAESANFNVSRCADSNCSDGYCVQIQSKAYCMPGCSTVGASESECVSYVGAGSKGFETEAYEIDYKCVDFDGVKIEVPVTQSLCKDPSASNNNNNNHNHEEIELEEGYNYVGSMACTEDGDSCDELCESYYGEGMYAVAYVEDGEIVDLGCGPKCSTPGKTISECLWFDEDEIYYTQKYECVDAVSMNIGVPTDYEDCDKGVECNADKTACEGSEVPPETDLVDGWNYYGDGECTDSNGDDITCNEACAAYYGAGYYAIAYYYEAYDMIYTVTCAQPCSKAGEDSSTCLYSSEDKVYYTQNYTCTDLGAKTLNVPAGYEDCDGECNEDKTACGEVDPTVVNVTACSDEEIQNCKNKYGTDEYGLTPDEVSCYMNSDKPTCTGAACSTVGDEKVVCSDTSWTVTKYTCAASTDGKLKLWANGVQVDECEFGCDDKDSTKCSAPLTADQGQACTSSTRADKCEGNIMSWCNQGEVSAINCAKKDGVCDILDYNGSDYADCFYEDSNTCDKVGETYDACDSDWGEIDSYICLESPTTHNKYYIMEDYEECDYGCDDGDTTCPSKLVDDQGEDCDPEERADRCDDNIYSSCVEGWWDASVEAEDCSKSGKSCVSLSVENKSLLGCYATCDKVGDVEYKCDDSYSYYGEYYVDIYVCTATDKGNYLIYSDYANCDGTCSSKDNDVSACGLDKLDIDDTVCDGKESGDKVCANENVVATCGADNNILETTDCTSLFGGDLCISNDDGTGKAHCGCEDDDDCPDSAPYCNALSSGYHVCMATQQSQDDPDKCDDGFVSNGTNCCLNFSDDGVKAYALTKWDKNGDSCISQTEAEDVTELESSAFKENKAIASINDLAYFKNLATLGNYAFQDSSVTGDVVLPNVKTLAGGVFRNATGLNGKMDLANVTVLGVGAFINATNITSFNLPKVTEVKGQAFSAGNNDVVQVGYRSLSLPAAVKIGASAFKNVGGLSTLELTAAGSIDLTNDTAFNNFDASDVDLVLNKDKEADITTANTWGGKTWKSITFIN